MQSIKPKIYFDTSVLSDFYDTDKPVRTALTRMFWQEYLNNFKPYVSQATKQEVKKTKQLEKRTRVMQLLAKCKMLEIVQEVEDLAEQYVKARIIPPAKAIDALHIACATHYKIDFLASWNIRHMANPNQRKKLTDYNSTSGLFVPQLTTPEELMKVYEQENLSDTKT